MTPLYIEIGLHYAVRCDEFPRLAAPACKQAVADFLDRGLLKRPEIDCGRDYEPTDGLKAWVDALCAVPFPVQLWVIPERQP